ncbi:MULTISPECIES: hypothetical protein [Vibrio]|uniref:Uncharacterized protein n=1 Tax=Vibrio owensii CAIM 1854 = LMG 25443 TaxID=1229493 RepID=A0A0C1Z867_9VIBR|nr:MULTISPECIES: hypothetical protein [Vibrio]KIF53180.1 hypothetical protein H735_09600 [Vibrio owensii CAIM 1854 = LMG 25443]NOH36792.1 hypothetical protein [Vibrio coralliilyticus]
MDLSEILEYLNQTGWSESKQLSDHYVRDKTKGIVAIDRAANQAFIVERIGDIPWSRISNAEQFEQDLTHLQ